MVANSSYTVSVTQPFLRQEESVKQLVNSLQYVEQVAHDVFNRITTRVAQNREQLVTLNNRVNVALAKISKIRGSTKATTVFSSAKYPAPETLDDYRPLFGDGQTAPVPNPPKLRPHEIRTKHSHMADAEWKDRVNYFAIDINVAREPEIITDEDEGEGLGRLPKHLPSVSSLLLFNTAENPYKKYVTLDPLSGVQHKTRTLDEDGGIKIDAAPQSILSGDQMLRGTAENYFYSPGMGAVPEIQVPGNLPDLPGVADDIAWEADLGPSIAPSMPGSNMPELPTVAGVAAPRAQQPGTVSTSVSSTPSSVSAPPPPSAAPPPPPPPSAAPPPPPPPPADMGPPPPAPANVPLEVAEPDSGRGGLLDAIRAAGGAGKAKLKSVKDRKLEAKKAKKEAAAAGDGEEEDGGNSGGGGGGGDMMGDLIATLNRRRKGISGSSKPSNNERSEESSGNPMDKISAMIPAPKARAESQASDHDAWE
ncbi:WAS family protein [Capsaspora owczarzaki ATCC 30864]|uniref:WAS family protein n=1 Tax=Capsaspora owczarzaki (strain ATCC 30864) TaxID=595528 RepID=A0A0D2WJE6_CAPO3|nr:WAS family protein [Capsaspora owczarzaki ATCC 30864]KJE90140.1 WAS family protein [Capsaspora owczarzaki ATCC 30864]|eukprot:XP_004364356.1 WAS family protein [Capsaspora owczarzaki ATCC 30864]